MMKKLSKYSMNIAVASVGIMLMTNCARESASHESDVERTKNAAQQSWCALCDASISNAQSHSLTQQDLLDIPKWPSRKIHEYDWSPAIAAAKRLQLAEQSHAVKVLRQFERDANRRLRDGVTYAEALSGPFLALRVAFELPEQAELQQSAKDPIARSSMRTWGGWLYPWRFQKSDSINLAWPLTWNAGRPRLVDPHRGYSGAGYSALSEFEWYVDRYKYRDLSQVE